MRLRNSSHGVCTSSTKGCISHSPPPLRGAPCDSLFKTLTFLSLALACTLSTNENKFSSVNVSRREPQFRFPCRGGACSSRNVGCVPIETGRRGAVPYNLFIVCPQGRILSFRIVSACLFPSSVGKAATFPAGEGFRNIGCLPLRSSPFSLQGGVYFYVFATRHRCFYKKEATASSARRQRAVASFYTLKY